MFLKISQLSPVKSPGWRGESSKASSSSQNGPAFETQNCTTPRAAEKTGESAGYGDSAQIGFFAFLADPVKCPFFPLTPAVGRLLFTKSEK